MTFFDKMRGLWSAVQTRLAGPAPAPGHSPPTAGGDPAPAFEAFDDFADELEASLGDAVDLAMVGSDRVPSETIESTGDGGPEELFASIAATYCQPVKDFVFELKQGKATHEWIEMCMPVMGSIIHGAESLELHAVAQRMVEFRDALTTVESTDRGAVFDDASRDLILERYEALVEALPRTFDGGDESRRDSIIIHALLQQVPDVGRVTLEKLYAAGLTSLATLFLANPHDMSAVTGVPPWLCERICQRVSEHRQQLEGGLAAGSDLDTQAQLGTLLAELQRHQEELRQISGAARAATDSGSAKRDCIRRRKACALQIDLLLAQLGQVEFVEELRKLGIERRIERLEQYLAINPVAAVTSAPVSNNASEIG